MATWRDLITRAMDESGDDWTKKVHMVPMTLDLDNEFDDGYGGTEGAPFTLWTVDRVYFPVCYDGSEWVASVPRNPCNKVTSHIGGG
jgi:hypothetical protein